MERLRLCLVTFGVIVGIVGILHGSAELLQGGALVESRSVEALPSGWPNEAFHSLTNGSPVFTVLTGIPFYVLGILAISVSTTLIVCAVTVFRTADLRVGAALLAVLSVGVFLVGAGQGTPVFVSAPVIVTVALSASRSGATATDDGRGRRLLRWFWTFHWIHILSWILFFPGLFVFSFYSEIPTALFLLAFVSMPIGVVGAVVTGYRLDRTPAVATSPQSPDAALPAHTASDARTATP